MSGAKFHIKLDDSAATALFDRISQGAASALPLFTEIGSALEGTTKDRFRTKTAPDGTPWLELTEGWLQRKRERGFAEGILTMRGDLLNSISFEAGADFAQIVAGPTDYALIHQQGGQAGRDRATKIDARPYMGLSPEDEAEIREAAEEWLAGLVGG